LLLALESGVEVLLVLPVCEAELLGLELLEELPLGEVDDELLLGELDDELP
jgi:hypothetical protein